jgi:hypothetical protein
MDREPPEPPTNERLDAADTGPQRTGSPQARQRARSAGIASWGCLGWALARSPWWEPQA